MEYNRRETDPVAKNGKEYNTENQANKPGHRILRWESKRRTSHTSGMRRGRRRNERAKFTLLTKNSRLGVVGTPASQYGQA